MIVIHFDVLALPSDEVMTRQPSPEGRRLWNTFFTPYHGRLIVLIDHTTDLTMAGEWLRREQFKASIIHETSDWVVDGSHPRADAVWQLSAQFGKVEWYIDSDIEACAETLSKGIPTLIAAVPSVSRPEWRSPKQMRGWDTIASELDEQAKRRADKTWGDIE